MSFPPIPIDAGFQFTKKIHNDTYPEIDSRTKSDHTGRYVFITGASKGVGRATAISYAKAGVAGIALGARSDLTEVEAEVLAAAKAAGKTAPKVLKVKLDVMKYSDVENAAKITGKEFGKLDILINNAGYLNGFETIEESGIDEYWRNYEINLRGAYWMTRAFLPLILKGGEKTIVNLSSAGAHMIGLGASAYQTSKFALLRFTEHLIAEYVDKGLVAYCVHPGAVMTELAAKTPAYLHEYMLDTPEVAADTIVFLTAERRLWLNGRYISCTWDMPEVLAREEEIVKGDKLFFRMKF